MFQEVTSSILSEITAETKVSGRYFLTCTSNKNILLINAENHFS